MPLAQRGPGRGNSLRLVLAFWCSQHLAARADAELDCLPVPRWNVPPPRLLPRDGRPLPPPCVDNRPVPAAPARRLNRIYEGGPPFFDDDKGPYVNMLIHDSHDENCDLNYTTPVTVMGEAGYPADGTAPYRTRQQSCGVAIARFVFFTSDKEAYTDPQYTAQMMVKVDCALSKFLESDTCENVLDATSDDEFGFPRISRCRFMMHEMRLILTTRLRPNTRYDVTVKLLNPAGRHSASENSFHLTTEYYQRMIIEGTKSPVDMTHIIPNTKDWSVVSADDYQEEWDRQRGYLTAFSWKPKTGEWFPDTGRYANRFTFELRNWGRMTGTGSLRYAVKIIAYPTNVWKFCLNGDCHVPGTGCNWDADATIEKATCTYEAFQGASASETNGMIIRIGSNEWFNLNEEFTIRADNPVVGVNLYWTATSYRFDPGGNIYEPYTVILNSPVPVLGVPRGEVVNYEISAINQEQWLELEFKPGNTLLGVFEELAGLLVIIPPDNFELVPSAAPQDPSPEYNALPCTLWPAPDRESRITPRWVCTVGDQAIFQSTSYRVRLRVRNPTEMGSARSWRVEMWQFFSAGGWVGGNQRAVKPIAVSRSILGMHVSGTMSASIAPDNQLLGGMNVLRFEFVPSHDIGSEVNTRLKVVAPEGFIIVKRCQGFDRAPPMVLPECTCEGSDANSFDLIFTHGSAIKANTRYIFKVGMKNPDVNIPSEQNIWRFDTVRPNGVPRDTARYQGFYLFPDVMAKFDVVATTRAVGPGPVILRFTSARRIPRDDFLTIRAPLSVTWHEDDLKWSSVNTMTEASTIETAMPVVDPQNKNILQVQITTAAEANVEYGFYAQCVIPQNTPVPNRWWIEQKRQTGLAAPNNWRYIAATGAEGFKSLVLVNALVEPFNLVEEAWENPTLITFEATRPVQSTVKTTPTGVVNVSAEVRVIAPPGFTWICPLEETIYVPEFAVVVPSNVECHVDHNDEDKRNQLHLYFPDGIQAEVRYALTIAMVNGRIDTLDLSKNYFRIVTMLDVEEIEDAIVPGFRLAKHMDNTRFYDQAGVPFTGQNFFPEFEYNKVTFYLGTIEAINLEKTILEVKAPRGFEFPAICTSDVRYPGGEFGLQDLGPLPEIKLCQNLAYQDVDKTYIAHIVMEGPWLRGTTGIEVTVKNPMRTPPAEVNFWSFTIYDMDMLPLQSEARTHGFKIAVVVNPIFRATLMGNGVDREAAINAMEISFSLTTHLEGQQDLSNQIRVQAPEGFRFPNVCRFFSVDTGRDGEVALPEETTCAGDGDRVLIITLPIMRPLYNNTRYGFRFRVINPMETVMDTNNPRWWWKIWTRVQGGREVDQTRDIPSFPVYNRVSFIQVDTLSSVGLNTTTYRFLFRTSAPIPPKQTLTIYPPPGFIFNGLDDNRCLDVDPMVVKRQFDEDYGMKAVIGGVTRLPEWTVCKVYPPPENKVVLTNEEPLLGGRPLINGPVFETFVMNATNAEASPPPGLNLFRVVAKTTIPYGVEEFVGEGWTIYPELLGTSVQTSNPGFGLYTNFTFTMRTVSRVPAGGSIRIVAPEDYYFGPLIETPETEYDPLVSAPGPQTSLELERPMEKVDCMVLRPYGWACPFELTSCEDRDYYQELKDIGVDLRPAQAQSLSQVTLQCRHDQEKCETTTLSDLISCHSNGKEMILELQEGVVLPARRTFQFLVQGYNTHQSMASRRPTTFGSEICFDCPGNTWMFQTRDRDSEKTVLDNKEGIPGFSLEGIISVWSIIPSDTKTNSIENIVTVTLSLAVACDPRGTLRITHPMEYMRSANAAFQGAPVTTGPNFPRLREIRQSLNVIEIIALEERIPADVNLEISIIMSNPDLSPSRAANVWTFEASSARTGEPVIKDINYNVSGFKVFGEFSLGAVRPTVRSPSSDSIIGVWFVLKSELPEMGRDYNKGLRIWIPKRFTPVRPPRPPLWRPVTCGEEFSVEYNPNREGIVGFPTDINYFGLPSGASCQAEYSHEYEQYFLYIKVDGPSKVRYGDHYAFEVGVTNPAMEDMPPAADNIWRLETVMNDVILHLRRGIAGYELEQIKTVLINWEDSTKQRRLHPIQFYIQSDKYIPGGSKVKVTGPETFQVGCVFFRPISGLSSTTTCLVKARNIVEFTIDSQDPKAANTPFEIRVMWLNPEFTPRENWWKVEIFSPLEQAIDVRDFMPGFDITDKIEVYIDPTFAYLGEYNKIRVIFLQYTIMNQADRGNELVLTAPAGYTFPEECRSFNFRLTDNLQEVVSDTGYQTGFVFPPPGTECFGFDNGTVVVRLPNGSGLLKNNYTLEVDVLNPGYRPNGTNVWKMITRVRNNNGTKIVDANYTVQGFDLSELLPIRTDEGGAWRNAPLPNLMILGVVLCSFLSHFLSAGEPTGSTRTAGLA